MHEQNNSEDLTFLYIMLSIVFFAWLKDKIGENGFEKIKLITSLIALALVDVLLLYFTGWKILQVRQKRYRASNSNVKIIEQSRTKKELSERLNQCKTEKEKFGIMEQSKTNEKSLKKAEIAKRKNVNIAIDISKGYFRHKELNLEEIKYLLAKGYRISEHKSIANNKTEKFLIKPRFNESENHCFVLHDIEEFLESKGIECKKYITKKPDITFELNGKKWAIEVETGNKINKDRKIIVEKVNNLKLNYDSWFFVITNRNFTTKYRKCGRAIELRYLHNQLSKIVTPNNKPSNRR